MNILIFNQTLPKRAIDASRPAREIWSYWDWEDNKRSVYTDSLIPEHVTEGAD